MASKTPVYFLSHGGPPLMFDTKHPAYQKLQEIGREITQRVKPKAVVVFSAHWQGGPASVQVNTGEITDLIYDYYGFPPEYYTVKYPNTGSTAIAEQVIGLLNSNGIATEAVSRGLDHGVFVSFRVAFDPEKNPLNVPIVQVSLFDTEDPHQHLALGRAVAALRTQGILVVGAGMTVHNLRDFRFTRSIDAPPMPYAVSFDAALRTAVETTVEAGAKLRDEKMVELLKRKDAREAHPTFEHLLPMHVATGAAGEDRGMQLWSMPEKSLAWGMYRFGDVPMGSV